jgi:hypothetical protein
MDHLSKLHQHDYATTTARWWMAVPRLWIIVGCAAASWLVLGLAIWGFRVLAAQFGVF